MVAIPIGDDFLVGVPKLYDLDPTNYVDDAEATFYLLESPGDSFDDAIATVDLLYDGNGTGNYVGVLLGATTATLLPNTRYYLKYFATWDTGTYNPPVITAVAVQ